MAQHAAPLRDDLLGECDSQVTHGLGLVEKGAFFNRRLILD
jgi:hypothetical protein